MSEEKKEKSFIGKIIKFIVIFIVSIITFCLICVIAVVCVLSGGKNFKVEKTSLDIEEVIGDSIYEAFNTRTDNNLNVLLSEEDLNAVLTNIIITELNSEYQDTDYIYKTKCVKLEKAKIELVNGKLRVKARAKVGPISTTFVASGKVEYDAASTNIIISLSNAKLGHLSVKNPLKYMPSSVDSKYISDGKLIYPLELSERVPDGPAKVIIDNCTPSITIDDDTLKLSFDMTTIINEGDYNKVSYTTGQIETNTLSGYTLGDPTIKVTMDDFNGYAKNEYGLDGWNINSEILGHDYEIKVAGPEYNDVYFDNVAKKLYVEINMQGIPSYLIMDYVVSTDGTSLIFTTSNITLNGIAIQGALDDVINQMTPGGEYKLSLAKLEASLGGHLDINSVSIDSNGDFIFGVTAK